MENELKGTGIHTGVVTGQVRILRSLDDVKKVAAGDILVATTFPLDWVLALKLASGVVVDNGGMTSHVAKNARELQIPCVVGTKTAIELFQDGDTIEVNADAGIVRKINEEL